MKATNNIPAEPSMVELEIRSRPLEKHRNAQNKQHNQESCGFQENKDFPRWQTIVLLQKETGICSGNEMICFI